MSPTLPTSSSNQPFSILFPETWSGRRTFSFAVSIGSRLKTRATRSFRLGGGVWFEKTAIAAICVAQNGAESHL